MTKPDYLAGQSTNLGACLIKGFSWIDYQLLALTRNVQEPFNQVKNDDNETEILSMQTISLS